MPIYEYKCQNCGYKFDEFFKSTLAYFNNQAICSQCSEFTAIRIMSIANFNRVDLRCQRLFGHNLAGQWTSEKHKAESKG